jgi:arabinofuranosyltransferase
VAATAAVYLVLAWTRRWVTDDAFIVFRVVDHVLAGHGPSFNAGERVEVASSPLWLMLLVLARLLVPVGALEWLAVGLGLVFAVGGLVAGLLAAAELAAERPGRLLPLGALVIIGMPPFWDYATSGLESGLGFAWIAACAWGLARPSLRAGNRNLLVALLISLGPLVRPDFVVFTGVFGAALLAIGWSHGWRWVLRTAVVLAALPLVTETLRMGYYAALVPNTVLAKEGGMAYWSQGWLYLRDLFMPGAVVFAFAIVVIAGLAPAANRLARVRASGSEPAGGDRFAWIAFGAPLAAGLLHGLAVVRGGGDFMHGRLLLPALFAVLLPVLLIRVRQPAETFAVALVAAWAVIGIVLPHVVPPPTHVPDSGIADERAFYSAAAGTAHPVTLADYATYERVPRGLRPRELAARGERTLFLHDEPYPLAPDAVPDVVIEYGTVGLTGYAAGTDVHVLDSLGIGDAFGARIRLEARGRPGHEKPAPQAWAIARYGDPAADQSNAPDDAAEIRAAREALSCPPLLQLRAAISAPLTWDRFLTNIRQAPALTGLRFPADPHEAAEELCG